MKKYAGRRVLMLLENCPYCQDPRVIQEATALTEAGYQVSVISPDCKRRPWWTSIGGVRVYQFPSPPDAPGLLGYLLEYGYALMMTFVISLFVFLHKGFDILHTHNPPDLFVFIAMFYKLLGKRFVYDHHDLSPEMYIARSGGRGNRLVYHALVMFEKLSCRFADRVIATNQSYKRVEIERGGVPEDRITIVRNGPDLLDLRPVASDENLRREGKTIIAYVGVMGLQDGVDYLLRAIRHLVYDLGRREIVCVLVGAGEVYKTLKEMANQLGIADYMWFTGWVERDQVARYLNVSDICVAPEPSNAYTDRSTMIKMMEYMTAAKPIVAFDLPEHRFTAQAAALYVPSNDELAFARALAQLMDAPERRRAMGSYGRQRIESELAWQYSAQNLLAAYRTLLPDECQQRLSSL
jgi:glycosyltransferase involved in cell wall biosynthesis